MEITFYRLIAVWGYNKKFTQFLWSQWHLLTQVKEDNFQHNKVKNAPWHFRRLICGTEFATEFEIDSYIDTNLISSGEYATNVSKLN